MTKLGEIEDLDLLPKHVFQLVRCGPEGPPGAGDPATVPAIRWSVTSMVEDTDQRVDGFGS